MGKLDTIDMLAWAWKAVIATRTSHNPQNHPPPIQIETENAYIVPSFRLRISGLQLFHVCHYHFLEPNLCLVSNPLLWLLPRDSYPDYMAQLHFQTPSSSLGNHVKAFPSLLQFSQTPLSETWHSWWISKRYVGTQCMKHSFPPGLEKTELAPPLRSHNVDQTSVRRVHS